LPGLIRPIFNPSFGARASLLTAGHEHIVKEGKTLSAIATVYKVKPAAIIEANNLKNHDNLRKGQKLLIPQ